MEPLNIAAPSNLDRKYARKYPELGAGRLPVDDCISQEYYGLEKKYLFKRSWICVARHTEIPNVGDYLVKDIAVLDTSVTVVRGRDKKLRAFHNYCPHRLNKINKPGRGNCKAFICRFHGWTFDLDGRLAHLDNEHLFADFQREKNGLHSIHLEEWEGFVFINIEDKPQETLKEWMGPMYDRFSGYFDGYKLTGHLSVEMACNWKLSIDSQTEAYHAPNLHARTLGEAVSGKENPTSLFHSIDFHGRHMTAATYANPGYIPTPSEIIAGTNASRTLYPASAETLDKLPEGINPGRHRDWIFDLDLVFPNFGIFPSSGYFIAQWFWPEGANKTRLDVMVYTYEPTTIGDVIAAENTHVHMLDVLREDFSTLEGTQEGMESGVQPAILLCDEEVTVRHTHYVVDQYIRAQRALRP